MRRIRLAAAFGFLFGAIVGCGSNGAKAPVDAGPVTDVPVEAQGDDGARDAIAGDTNPILPPDGTPPLAGVDSVFPARDGTAICTDAPLRLFFQSPPVLGTGGAIRVFDASNPGTPVDSIDLAAPASTITISGRAFYYKPVIVAGNEVYVYLRKVLHAGATYYVTIDAGVFLGTADGAATGAPVGSVWEASTWRFTVRAAAPAAGAAQVTVAADGTGDFCTVQGAVDYVPAGNTTPVTITVNQGNYREIVEISAKHKITLYGEDRKLSVITYPNNGQLQVPPGGTASLGTKFRAMLGADGANDLTIENITLWNPSPQLSTNGQSETLRSEGGQRLILRNADFKGLQDTLLITGTAYAVDSYIEGNVDFIWGNGVVFFERCEIRDVVRKGYMVQARNVANSYGYVFVDSTFTADPPTITGHFLARTDRNNLAPASQVAYVNCKLGPHISPLGWLVDGYERPAPDAGSTYDLTQLRFQEYQSTDLAGALLDVSQRIPESKQLTADEAAQMRDPTVVLGGWNPRGAVADAGSGN